MPDWGYRIQRHWLTPWAALLVVLGFVLYGRTLLYGFTELDDAALIYQNPAVRSLSWHGLKTIFTTFDPELYIPLTLLTYQIDAFLGGMNPVFFHVHSLLYHIINAILVLAVTAKLTGKRGVAIVVSVLFLAHPLHVEAVVWASARKDLLSTTFFLLSLLLYLQFLDRGGRARYEWSLATFVLGLMAKVSVIPLPAALLLIDGTRGRPVTRHTLMEKAPFLGVALLFGIVALLGKSNVSLPSLGTLLLVGARHVLVTIEHLLLPLHLSPIYGATDAIALRSPAFASAIILTILLAGFAIIFRRKIFGMALAFFLLMLVPSAFNLIRGEGYILTADRYGYTPSIGLLLVLVLLADAILKKIVQEPNVRKRVSAVLTSTIAGMLCLLTVFQSALWVNAETLTVHTLALAPKSRLALLWRGNALSDAGAWEQALELYDAALAIREDSDVRYNRALLMESLGRTAEAEADFQRAIELDPEDALSSINLGRLAYLAGRREEAKQFFTSAQKIAPHLAMPLFNLGVLASEEHRPEEALAFYRAALVRDPRFIDARVNLASTLFSLGQTQEALEELERAERLDPNNPTILLLIQQARERGIIE